MITFLSMVTVQSVLTRNTSRMKTIGVELQQQFKVLVKQRKGIILKFFWRPT